MILFSFERGKAMISEVDIEKLIKSSEGASLLVEDLGDLARSSNPLLAELSVDLLKSVVEIEQKLRRIVVLTKANK
jgi:hypothetical protein